MKIYTEIIWSWDDDKGELVQESSKSYDYDGPLTLLHEGESHPPVKYLEYPSTIGGGGGGAIQHWISFKGFDFKKKLKPTLDIALYIPNDALQTSYKSNYESTALGGLGKSADKAVKMFENAGDGGIGLPQIQKLISAQMKGMGSEAKTLGLLKAGEKAAALGVGDTKTLMERATGSVMNPYMVAAYKGPTDMREHKFSFKMLPQSVSESKTCAKIVHEFKKAMLPSHSDNADTTSAPSMLFGYPYQFKIEYFINGDKLKHSDDAPNPMFNIGKSVLTACDLNYTTQDVPLFFDKSQYPVSIDMALSFMEIGVMYRERIDQGF